MNNICNSIFQAKNSQLFCRFTFNFLYNSKAINKNTIGPSSFWNGNKTFLIAVPTKNVKVSSKKN